MSWLHRLHQTYDIVSANPNVQGEYELMPFYHVRQNVHIIITIDEMGKFISARLTQDANGKIKANNIIIPATNDSATRTSSPVAHPLVDKLCYVAKDFFALSNNKKDVFDLYHKTLKAWCDSEFSHAKAQAVLRYIEQGQVVKDLVNAGIIYLDDNQQLAYPNNASDYPNSIFSMLVKNGTTFDQGSAFVAWEVISSDLSQANVVATWQDKSLATAWQNYYASLDGKHGFCAITGEQMILANKHPSRILKSANNAKLISANDMSGFTFLGRFTDDDESIKADGYQAVNIGAIVTEKAHACLSWLLTNQGKEEAGQAIVAWAISGNPLPQPTTELHPDVSIDDDFADDFDDDFSDDFDDENFTFVESNEIEPTVPIIRHHQNIGRQFSQSLMKTLAGYRQKLDAHEQISIISLDAATPGRMAVTYYHESMPNDYLNALQSWYEHFAWYQVYFDKNKQKKITIGTPTPYQIAECAYGKRLSDSIKKQVVSQVLPVIVEGEYRAFPRVLMELCIQRACNPLSFEQDWQWQQAVGIACGLYRGFYSRTQLSEQRSYTVALQEDYCSRDYLYGRLLAIAEDIESLALYIAGENRVTTAQRYMQQFSNRPFSTWRNIELALDPYMKRLNNNRSGYLLDKQTLLNRVMAQFNINDFNDDRPLSGEFLLGYHCQKMAFTLAKQAKKDASSTESNETATE